MMDCAKTNAQRVYDGMLSLGVNCATAMQLEVRGLRTWSGPLDWITLSPSAVELGWQSWTRAIANDFQLNIDWERLKLTQITEEVSADYMGNLLLNDEQQGVLFPHDFSEWPASSTALQKVKTRYQRRATRVVEQLTTGGRWLLVFNSGNFSCSIEDLLELRSHLRQRFPNAQIDLFAVFFGQAEETNGEEVAPGVFVTKTARAFRDSYDFGGQNATWNWLDGVALREPIDKQADLKRRAVFDSRLLAQVPRWLKLSQKTLKLYHKTYVLAHARGYCRFADYPLLTCKLPMWLWRKTRQRCFLPWVNIG